MSRLGTAVSARLLVDGREAAAGPGATLFELAESVGVHVPTSCRAQGKCRECLVEIEAGGELLSDRTAEEAHLSEPFRLACRTRVAGPGRVVCHTMRRGALQIVESGGAVAADPGGAVDPRWRRHGSRLLRDGRVVGEIAAPPLGLAVDLGTTTVVLALEDLESGRRIAVQSFENPQRFGGSDIMARIQFDCDHPGRLLQRVLLGYLRRAIEAFPVDPGRIVEMVVAGNTTMRDLFFGLDPRPIGQLPYRSVTEHELRRGERPTTSLELAARRLRLPLHPQAVVYSLPLVSGHVGADAAACLLACGLADGDTTALSMDIGTNTEVFIGHRGRLLAASCPAGPAFEGGGVRCGMPALEGAIERIAIAADGTVETRVIGGGAPLGVCGSGLVDLLAELRRSGRMNAQGRLTDEDGESGEFWIDAAHGLSISEADINELAQAKGANAAGVRIVADRFGVAPGAVDRLYLAGGFGRHLDTTAARRIGLIPDLPDDKIVQVGNAALEGASRIVRSATARRRIEALVRRVEHVSLETHPEFFEYFVDGCQFEPF